MSNAASEDDEAPEFRELYVSVGVRVRALRELAEMSQKDLSLKTNIRQPYLFEIEKYGVNLSLKLLSKLAAALEVPPRALLPGASDAQDYETKYRVLREKVLELCSAVGLGEARRLETVSLIDSLDRH